MEGGRRVSVRPRELVAAILAAGISLAIVVICVGVATHSGPISAEESTLIATVLGAAVGALATYLGTSRNGGDEPEPQRAPEPTSSEAPPERTSRLPPPAGKYGDPTA